METDSSDIFTPCADVPDALLRISQPHLHKILEKLASRGKWQQMEVVVNKARANDVPRNQFARNMSILALVRDGGLCGAEAQRLQVRPGGGEGGGDDDSIDDGSGGGDGECDGGDGSGGGDVDGSGGGDGSDGGGDGSGGDGSGGCGGGGDDGGSNDDDYDGDSGDNYGGDGDSGSDGGDGWIDG